ncbi:family 16 glycoside hydrolase [Photobacterium satsumensis]|uniref:family 16 glycoside hydrolase n=1 Tax=Photobacterium satsumensis TaxID=2910239 RepID=UPI003D112403
MNRQKRSAKPFGMWAITLCIGLFANVATALDFENFPLDTLDNTVAEGVKAEVVDYHGQKGIHVSVLPEHKSLAQGGCDNCTYLALQTLPFRDGTIELLMAGEPQQESATGFVGIVFRVSEDMSEYEGVYLRPVNAVSEDETQRELTIQYFSYPDHSGDVLRETAPGQYESAANIRPGQWFKLTAEINNNQAIFYIDGEKVLVVDRLFHGSEHKGVIGLITQPGNNAYFSDLKIKHSQ